MTPEKVTLTRTDLYQKVWSTPLQKLAKAFGVSDVGLAKVCRRHQIPLPGRGYWARIQSGQELGRSALPACKDPSLDTIHIYPSEKKRDCSPHTNEGPEIPTIHVAEDRQITHPLVRRIERSLTQKSKNERGLLLARKGKLVPLRVSPEAVQRSMRILDALLCALDDAKHRLGWPKPYDTPLKIIVLDEQMQLIVTEAVERKEHKPTKEEMARQKLQPWQRPPQWDYASTGRLKLSLESCDFPSIRHAWTDGKRRRLEASLGEILVECERTGQAIKRAREAHTEAERRWAEERRRQAEAAIRKAEYDRKAAALEKLARSWQEGKLIRDFSAALRASSKDATVPDDLKMELETLINWAGRHADYVCPLTDLKWTVSQFKSAAWPYGH